MRRGKELMIKAFRKSSIDRIPVAPLIGVYSSRFFKVHPLKAFMNGKVMADLQYRISKYFGIDIVTTWMDLTYEAEALGARVEWGDMPRITNYLTLTSISEIDSLPEDITSRGRFPVYLEALKVLKGKASEEFLICSYLSGPLTLAINLLGARKVFKSLMLDSDFTKKLLEKLTSIQLNSVKALVNSGAECIIVLEPAATLINRKMFEEFILDKLKEISEVVHQYNRNIILHICGKSSHLLEEIDDIGVEAFSIDDNVDIGLVFRKVKETSIMGNINTSSLLHLTPGEIREATRKLLEKVEKERFILSTGCEVPYNTPRENIEALVKAINCYQ